MENQKEPIRIEIRIDRASARRAIVIAGSIVLLATAGGVGFAVPVTFADGNVLTAAQLNNNFSNLEQRLTAVERRLNGSGKYSMGATYCGATATSYTGNLGGYVTGKGLCEATCGGSRSAHMCVTEEVLHSVATGMTVPYGWYSSGTFNGQSGTTQRDCGKWSSNTPGDLGAAYSQYGLFTAGCDYSQPVLCCD